MRLSYPGSLHSHTEYSNLRLRDSTNRIGELIDYAISLGHQTIAITEHDTVANAIKVEEYYEKVKKTNPNFKVILGNEIYLCRDDLTKDNFSKDNGDDYFHFILLAKDLIGHQQIRELSTRAWHRSYRTGKMVRVPTYYRDIVEIIGNNPGHVIGSTACLGGFLGTRLLQNHSNDTLDFNIKMCAWLKKMEGVFGKGNFFMEMQPSNNDEQIYVNRKILDYSSKLDIPYIITLDAHYLNKNDRLIHEAFLKAQEGDREVASFYETTYMMDTEELENYLMYLSDEELQYAYQNILKIRDMCSDYSLKKALQIPNLKWRTPTDNSIYRVQTYYDMIPNLRKFVESEYSSDQTMARLIVDKLDSDIRLREQRIYDEINANLETTWISSEVNQARWSAYYLNLQYSLDICWDITLVGPGRGSGVGFLLLYILDIIQINSLWESTQTFSWRLTDRFKGLLSMVTYLLQTV